MPASGKTAPENGGSAAGPAAALLPLPAPPVAAGADAGSLKRSKVPPMNLGLLGSIPAGAKYPLGTVGPQGLTDSKTWPDACKMLTDADIHTLLPKSGAVTRKGQHGQFLGGGETAKFATCKYAVPEPGDVTGLPSTVEISLDAVGDPAAIADQWKENFDSERKASAKYPDQWADYSSGSVGGAKCYSDGSSLSCAKDHYKFSVLGFSARESQDSDGPNTSQAQRLGYLEQVTANVAKTVALRMN